MEIDKFCQGLSLDKTISVELLETSEEVEEMEESMERILEVPLELSLENVREDREQFTELSVENQVHVFKKI